MDSADGNAAMIQLIERETDDIVGDLHKVRARLLESHGGDLKAIIEDLKMKQYESDHEIIEHIDVSTDKVTQNQQ